MTNFEKLKQRIKEDLGIETYDFKRTYVSHNMKSSGAFIWSCRDKEMPNADLGGCETTKTLLTKKEPLVIIRYRGFRREII